MRISSSLTLHLCFALLLLGLPGSSRAQSIMGLGHVGVGLTAGPQFPLAQDDAGNGGSFGIRGRVGVLRMLVIEPSISWMRGGDVEISDGLRLEGPDVTSYGLNLLLKEGGFGLTFYLTAGMGLSSVDLGTAGGSETHRSYNLGFGAEAGVGPVAVDVSPRLFVIETSGGGSRKQLGLVGGVHYYFN